MVQNERDKMYQLFFNRALDIKLDNLSFGVNFAKTNYKFRTSF